MFHCFLDDFEPGSTFATEGKTITESEILEFALKYDPQPFHMDVEAARASHFGGLVASGIQTMAIGLRMMLQAQVFAPGSSMGSPGLDELRWLKPVRPGDTLTTTARVRATRESRSRSDRGYVTFDFETVNQRRELLGVGVVSGTQFQDLPGNIWEQR